MSNGKTTSSNTPYDDVFRTLLNDCSSLIIPVINEVFGEDYCGDEEVLFYPNEHFIQGQDTSTKEKITDSCFQVIGIRKKKYHLEIHKVSGANKNSINLMKRVALKDMRDVRELLFENSWKEKTLKRFLEYCYMIDVKVALEGLNGEKTRGLKAAVKYVKEHDIGMTEEQIHAVYCVRYHILPLHVGI